MTTLPLFQSLDEELPAPEAAGSARPAPGGSNVPPRAPGLTAEQAEAVERREGALFVAAGAGSGKTRVLVERFVRAVVDDGCDVERMLAITFTEKAAAELRARIRARFVELGEREHARAVDSAWVSTIHGFCSRLLRGEALAAGLDPEYRVLSEHEADRLAADAFEGALEQFVDGPDEGPRLELVAAYGPDRLAGALRAVHADLRVRGHADPRLPRPPAPAPARVRRAHERFAAAVGAASESLSGEAAGGARVLAARDRLTRCSAELARLGPDEEIDPFELSRHAVRRGNARALRGAVFEELEEAHAECLEICLSRRAVGELTLLDELLCLFARSYSRSKAERSALDFEDLELRARDLLRARRALRDRLRARFDHVLVDELQDTNRLQSEILDLVAGDGLFAVGDELQSIYGFRRAEVAVFSERRAAAAARGRAVRLTTSFRSDARILDVLDAAFEPVFGPAFAPLVPARPDAAAERAEAREARVELIAVDRDNARWSEALGDEEHPFGAAMHGLPAWRAAEARMLARRIDDVLAAGEFAPAEVAVLLRSWSDVDRYEQALTERGVATYVAGGGGYWSSREVGDLRAYLATLANPRDEQALVAVLASPLVGASLDALALIRRHAGRGRPLWPALERALGAGEEPGVDADLRAGEERAVGDDEGTGGERADEPAPADGAAALGAPSDPRELHAALSEQDRERLGGFVEMLVAERAAAPRRSLPELIRRAVAGSGYDLAVLALQGGERRLANVRKLARLAREFEASEGRDLRRFLDALDRRVAAGAREGEAPVEGEGVDAVRLMTIHAAKGLEFPLVCVGDLGRSDPCETPLLRVSPDGRVGLRLPDPEGGAADALDARTLAQEAARAERDEERRLLWVAATRAERRLIVSGALDLESDRPTARAPAMEWLAPTLVPELREAHRAGRREGTCVRAWERGEGLVAWRTIAPDDLVEALPARDRRPAETGAAVPRSPQRPEAATGFARGGVRAGPTPPPPPEKLTRISYSALEAHRRCGYRFHLERELGLPPGEPPLGRVLADDSPSGREGVTGQHPTSPFDARSCGSVVHELLERIDPSRPVAPSREQIARRLRGRGGGAGDREVEEIGRLLAGFAESSAAERLGAASRVRREVPFAFPLAVPGEAGGTRSVLVEGTLDALGVEVGGMFVVDYKTDRLAAGEDLRARCEALYATQRLVYGLAVLRGGAEHVEIAHLFLERPDELLVARYGNSDADALEARLAALVGDVVRGGRAPSPTPGEALCRGCPGRARLCSWPAERTRVRR